MYTEQRIWCLKLLHHVPFENLLFPVKIQVDFKVNDQNTKVDFVDDMLLISIIEIIAITSFFRSIEVIINQ